MEAFALSGTDISAFSGTSIQHEMIVAYLATEYRISGDWQFVMRIGRRSDELAALYRKCTVASAAVLTAWNPYSKSLPDAENEIAQAILIANINRLALLHQPAYGSDPTGEWPPEPSRVVLGVDLQTAESLGREFRQNGIVWVGANAIPTLVLLR